MKECEWCGIDFRGPFKTVEEHVFCSDTCADEWRRDEYGDDVVDAAEENAADAAEEEAADSDDDTADGKMDGEGP